MLIPTSEQSSCEEIYSIKKKKEMNKTWPRDCSFQQSYDLNGYSHMNQEDKPCD